MVEGVSRPWINHNIAPPPAQNWRALKDRTPLFFLRGTLTIRGKGDAGVGLVLERDRWSKKCLWPIWSTDPFSWRQRSYNVIDLSISVRAPTFPVFFFLEEWGREAASTTLWGYMEACVPPPTTPPHCLPGMLNTRLNWATVKTAFPLKHLSTTIMFVPFVSQWLRNGPALRCFRGTQACTVSSMLTVFNQPGWRSS